MGLFSSKDERPQHISKASSGDVITSVISQEMKITGTLNFKGKARIDGTVDGDIKGEHFVLSETGRILGDMDLKSLICHGTVEGNIKAQLLTIHSTAVIHGNLSSADLTVESGAKLNGEIKASVPQQQPQTRSAKPSGSQAAAPKPAVQEPHQDTVKN